MTIVLFLDADWQPLRVAPWTRAITDMFLGKVEVIEFSRDRTIRGVARELPMPAVVRVLRRFRRERQAIRLKANRTPGQAGMHLRRLPAKPRHLPAVTVRMDRRNVPDEWRPYWNVGLDNC